MAYVRVDQRNAHLAGAVRLEFVNGREGKVAKAVLTAISNTRRGSGENREEEATAIQWTLWGKQAENAAEYLGKGTTSTSSAGCSNNNYEKDGETVYGLAFTAEEIDYLDSRAESEARRARRARRRRGRRRSSAERPRSAPAGAAASPAARASRRTPTPEPDHGRARRHRPRPPFDPHSTIEGNHHVLDTRPSPPALPATPASCAATSR